jgi:hypothetical protein
MSLQLLAKQMEAKGRKGDSMLVHMTAKEVAALQKMAESAGGSLSVNPETGLVEANFLKRMLPTLVGIGVGAATMNPYLGAAAGAAVGGYQAKRNDQDVGMGMLMGGLGGYGGAGLGAGLGAAGATGTAAQAISNPALAGQSIATGAGSQASMLAAQNAGFGAQGTASLAQAAGAATPSTAAQIGQGISALGKEAGRDAFMQGMGGVGGLAKTASMAAAPMMAPGKKPGEAPVDDEMIVYDYDVGRTGAELDPSATSAERKYFDGSYSPARRVRARDYPYAEGGYVYVEPKVKKDDPFYQSAEYKAYQDSKGPYSAGTMDMYDSPYFGTVGSGSRGRQMDSVYEAYQQRLANQSPSPVAQTPSQPASGMTGSSKAAFDYLMGNAPTSRDPAPQLMKGIRAIPMSTPGVGADNMYAFDPVTGTFLRNPNVAGAATSGSRVGTSFADSGGGGYEPIGPNPDFDTPEKQAAYYAENPTMGAITRAGQTALGFLPGASALFAAQEYMDPGFRQAQENITYGISAPPSAGSGYSLNNNAETGEGGGYASDYGTTSYGGEQYGDMPAGTYAGGGLMGLAKGGMKSGGFVVPADVVSMIGEGNTDAGYSRIKSMIPGATAIKGKDGGQADTVKTSIEGKQPARVAHGEMYIPPETVKRMGGAKKLYAMMDRVREQATGSKKQIKPVSLKRAMA